VLVNPLAAMDAGVQSAGRLMDVQSKQGEQLVGQALQQATDPKTGVLDTLKAQQIASSMGPSAAYAMQGFLKTGSQLRGEQIGQGAALYGLVGKLGASAAGDPSDANMAKIRAQGVALGSPPSGLAEIDRISALPVEQRSAEALKHTLGAIDALQRMHYQQGGVPTSWETGGGYQGGTYDPVTGALRPAGAPVTKTLTPGETVSLPSFTYTNPATGRPVVVPGADAVKLFGYGVLLPPNAQGHVDLPPGWTQVSGGGGAGGGGVVGADGKPVSPSIRRISMCPGNHGHQPRQEAIRALGRALRPIPCPSISRQPEPLQWLLWRRNRPLRIISRRLSCLRPLFSLLLRVLHCHPTHRPPLCKVACRWLRPTRWWRPLLALPDHHRRWFLVM
jgi:hypothetical protein